jgi:hypothetical protein
VALTFRVPRLDNQGAECRSVVLAENLYFSGNTVILDHGRACIRSLPIFPKSASRSTIASPGQSLGKVGATGA